MPIDDKVMYELAQRDAWADTDPSRIWVLKIHGTILRSDLPRSKIITCIRDPRDVLVSFRRFMDTSFEHALTVSQGVTRYVEGYRDHPADLLLRVGYEDIEVQPIDALRRVAGFLDVPLGAADEAEIVAMFGRERVRQQVAELSQDLRQRLEAPALLSVPMRLFSGTRRSYAPSTSAPVSRRAMFRTTSPATGARFCRMTRSGSSTSGSGTGSSDTATRPPDHYRQPGAWNCPPRLNSSHEVVTYLSPDTGMLPRCVCVKPAGAMITVPLRGCTLSFWK